MFEKTTQRDVAATQQANSHGQQNHLKQRQLSRLGSSAGVIYRSPHAQATSRQSSFVGERKGVGYSAALRIEKQADYNASSAVVIIVISSFSPNI